MNNISLFNNYDNFQTAVNGDGNLEYPITLLYKDETHNELFLSIEKSINKFTIKFKVPTLEEYRALNGETPDKQIPINIMFKDSCSEDYEFNISKCKQIILDGKDIHDYEPSQYSIDDCYFTIDFDLGSEHTITYILSDDINYNVFWIDHLCVSMYNISCVTSVDFTNFDSSNFIFYRGMFCNFTMNYSGELPEIIGYENLNMAEDTSLDMLFDCPL